MMGQSETMSTSLIIFITPFFLQVYQPRQCMQLCRAKTIFLSQTGTIWIFFIQCYCARSYTEHHWRCSKTWNYLFFWESLQTFSSFKKKKNKKTKHWNPRFCGSEKFQKKTGTKDSLVFYRKHQQNSSFLILFPHDTRRVSTVHHAPLRKEKYPQDPCWLTKEQYQTNIRKYILHVHTIIYKYSTSTVRSLKEERWHWQSTACVAVAVVVARRQKRAMAAKKKRESKRAANKQLRPHSFFVVDRDQQSSGSSEVYKYIAPFFSSLSFFIMFFCIRFVVLIFPQSTQNTHTHTHTHKLQICII